MVNEHFRVGVRDVVAKPEVQAVRGSRRTQLWMDYWAVGLS